MACLPVIFLAAAAVAAQAVDQSDPDIPEAKGYVRCVLNEATRLSPSGEPAETIGRAAAVRCNNQLSPAAKAISRASNAILQARGWSASSNSDDVKADLKATAQEAAILAVVEERLRAKQGR